MAKKNKRADVLRKMVLKTDEEGKEYLFYLALGGSQIRDYSPWTIKEYKEVVLGQKEV